MTASEQITAEVTTWPGVSAGPGSRGEFAFSVGRKQIGHLHAHGLSTRSCDAEEARAIHGVFGGRSRPVPVVAAKSYFGNLGAGGGMVELIASLLALQHGHLFPTLNYETPDADCPVAVVRDGAVEAGESFINLSVTPQAQASAVLIRAIEPTRGLDAMRDRRGLADARALCSGPGKLCQALAITHDHNGLPLGRPPLALHPRESVPEIVTGPRIGISKAVDHPWRYGLAGSPYLSKPFPRA